MKKMWVKKENIYHKPFYKQKLKMFMLFVFVTGFVFLAYQMFYMNQLVMSTVPHIVTTQPIAAGSSKQQSQVVAVGAVGADGEVR